MLEIQQVFKDVKPNTVLNFGELKLLYWQKTNKRGVSTFYNFVRECIDLGILSKNQDGTFKINVIAVRGLNANG